MPRQPEKNEAIFSLNNHFDVKMFWQASMHVPSSGLPYSFFNMESDGGRIFLLTNLVERIQTQCWFF